MTEDELKTLVTDIENGLGTTAMEYRPFEDKVRKLCGVALNQQASIIRLRKEIERLTP